MKSSFYQNLPERIKCLQWHSAEVKRAPENVGVLSATLACPIQAMSVENHALSVQFHIEITPSTVSEWGAIPTYKTALEKKLGEGALEKINDDANQYMADMNHHSRLLYENWKQTVFL